MPKSMIPKIRGVGEGYPEVVQTNAHPRVVPANVHKIYFAAKIPLRAGLAAAQANSRFLRSAVPFGFAQGPAPVGMTGSGRCAGIWFSRTQ
jgi:hypothetical protein